MDKLPKAFFVLCGLAVTLYILLFMKGHWRSHSAQSIYSNVHHNVPHVWFPRSVTAVRDPVSDSQTTSTRETASRHQTGSGTDSGTTTGNGIDSGTTTGNGTGSETATGNGTGSETATGNGTDSRTATGNGTDSKTTTGNGTDSKTTAGDGIASKKATGNGTDSKITTGKAGTAKATQTGNETAKTTKNENGVVSHRRLESGSDSRTNSTRGKNFGTVETKEGGGTTVGNNSAGQGKEGLSTRQTPQRYLIYLCDVMWSCGGWADRQKGIVSVYLLSLATGRKFGVMMTKPCNVTQFYTPRDVNWIIPKSEVKGKSFVVLQDMDNRERLFRRLKTMDFNKEYPQDVVYIRTNTATYLYGIRYSIVYSRLLPGWVRWNTLPVVFAKAWTSLMRPSQSIQHRLDDYLNSVGFPNRTHPFVCSHVRIGKSENIRNDFSVMTNVSDLPELWGFLDGYVKNGSLVFLATDNYRVRDLTRHRFGSNVSDTGGTIIHVERQARAKFSCPGFGVAILDQLILTHCDVLITSASGFSQVASYLRGSSKNLFTFQGGKIRKISI